MKFGSHVPALIINRETSIISADTVSIEQLYNFRMGAFRSDSKRIYPGAEALSADGFDNFSLHLLYVNGGEIAGAARIVKTIDGQLPLVLHFSDAFPKRQDFELSRFITNFDRSGKKAFLYLLPMIDICLTVIVSRVRNAALYADVLSGYPRTLNRETYLEFGFKSTNLIAFDEDYGLRSELFYIDPPRIDIFRQRIRYYQKFIGNLRMNGSVTEKFLEETLLTHYVTRERDYINQNMRWRRLA